MAEGESFELRGVEAASRAWFQTMVLGRDLCPFARGLVEDDRLRWVVSPAREAEALLETLQVELLRLVDAEPAALETTLLVHPFVLEDFEAQLEFMDLVDALLEALSLEGEIQVVAFHPQLRFGDAEDPAEHYANRSPFGTLHLLREASVAAAAAGHAEVAQIPRDNAAGLRSIGAETLARELAACRALAETPPGG